MKEILINNQYRIGRKIAEGGCGLVYLGTDLQSNEKVAIKLEYLRDEVGLLGFEAETYEILSGAIGIPRVRWFGQEGDYYVLVQDLLGPSLLDLFNYCGQKFSLKTVLLLADQLLSRIEYIHAKSYIHCDVKPSNFLMGTGRHGNLVYAVDFGLAQVQYVQGSRHCGVQHGFGFNGTCRFASINNHLGKAQSQRDDLESLGYVLVYFAHGSLPWQGLQFETEKEKNEEVMYMKMGMSANSLCKDLPVEFATYLSYCRSLEYVAKPNYSYLRRLFRSLFIREGFSYDDVYDWTVIRYRELHGGINEQISHTPPESQKRKLSSAKMETAKRLKMTVACGDQITVQDDQ